MYHGLHKLDRLGFSLKKTACYLGMDARTAKKYLQMSAGGFEDYLLRCQYRNKIPTPYEQFVKEKPTQFPDTSTAQIHDWLKERHTDLSPV